MQRTNVEMVGWVNKVQYFVIQVMGYFELQKFSTPLGQGKIPQSILQEEDFDVKAFPCLFPDGKNGKDQERKVKSD